uniref:AMP-binding domain-containing protein n=1 Tax=Mesocestoides corti TaxID=53468 RepID=A0A5K3EXJ7_MESCO
MIRPVQIIQTIPLRLIWLAYVTFTCLKGHDVELPIEFLMNEDDRCNLLTKLRENASTPRPWTPPDRYCKLDKSDLDHDILPWQTLSKRYCTISDPKKLLPDRKIKGFNYVTIKGCRFVSLFEISVRAALCCGCNYIVVLNPHAVGVSKDHIETAVSLLEEGQLDVVLGQSVPCHTASLEGDVIEKNKSTFASHTWGLYLIALKRSRKLLTSAHQLTEGVEWGTPSAFSRLWANLSTFLPKWSVVVLRDQLPEIMQVEDLPFLERILNIPLRELVDDSISIIIPIGPGHPDDELDLIEDANIIADAAPFASSLVESLDLIQKNSSGLRNIQVIVISSRPEVNKKNSTDEPSSLFSMSNPQLYQTDPSKAAVKLELHHAPAVWSSTSGTGLERRPPNRGELIHYAVEHFAKGSVLLFMEPGVHLPFLWDTAVFQCLEQPGVGMSSFAYRFSLKDKYMQRKHIGWAIRSYLANWLVNHQASKLQLPTAGQPLFLYSHYLRCLPGGYPRSSRRLHSVDLCLSVTRYLGRIGVANQNMASAGVPTDWLLRHGALRGAAYCSLVTAARLLGCTQSELREALSVQESPSSTHHSFDYSNSMEGARPRLRRLPLIQPDYLDGY